MEFDVGSRLRSVREAAGLSQRQLAKRAGVTNGMISLIEQNRTSPSVASLRKVLKGIPISMSDFFAENFRPKEKVFFRRDELTELSRGSISFLQVGGDLSGRKLQVMHETYKPGSDTGRSMLSHEGEEAGVIVNGHLEVTVDGERAVLGPGDAFYFDSRRPHRFRNTGNVPCEVVTACTPPSF